MLQRLVILVFVVSGLLAGLIVQSASASAFLQFAVPDTRIAGLFATSTVLGVVTGAVTFFALLRSRAAVKFTDEVIGELTRVTWPTREEALSATSTVIFTTVFVATLLGLYDLVWKNLADLVLFTG